jgi:hypothetical protein
VERRLPELVALEDRVIAASVALVALPMVVLAEMAVMAAVAVVAKVLSAGLVESAAFMVVQAVEAAL